MTPEGTGNNHISSEILRQYPVVSPPLIIFGADGNFQLDGWKTPPGINIRATEVILHPEEYKTGLSMMSRDKGIDVKDVVVESGMPVRISLQRGEHNKGSLVLSQISPDGRAEYQFEDVRDPALAVGLQTFLAQYVNYFSSETHILTPYIDGRPGSYFPVYLKLPRQLVRSTEQLTNISYQRNFLLRAREIAGLFDRHIRNEQLFSRNGLLHQISVQEGNASFYVLDNQGEYDAHNVDFPHYAILLQWCVGMFMRDLAIK